MGDRRKLLLIGLGLVLVTLIGFWRVFGCEFTNYDDDRYITENTRIHNGITRESFIWAFKTNACANWHPLTWLSHALDCGLFGPNPAGHHAVNLLFHAINVLLLFGLLWRMTGAAWKSGFVAALFAIHPLHVESVAWISERKDVLSTFFWLLTMWMYVRYAENPGPKRYLPVVAVFGVGLLAKPMLVTLPFVLLLMDYWPLHRFNPGAAKPGEKPWKLLWEKASLFAMAAASSVVTYVVQHTGGAVSPLERMSFGVRLANAFVVYVTYLAKMFWPAKLAVIYPHPGPSLPMWKVVGAALLLACITVLALVPARRRRYTAVGWLWYLGTLVPVIGLVQVGEQAMADRYTYVPLIGIFIAIAWGVPDLFSERVKGKKSERGKSGASGGFVVPPAALAATAGVVIVLLTAATWIQVGCWHDSISLFQHAIAVTGRNYTAELNLGVAMDVKGDVDGAITHYSAALEMNPRDFKAHNNLGIALQASGRMEEAVAHYQAALRIRPKFAEAHGNLANALAQVGNLEEAVAHYARLIELRPEDPHAYFLLGKALARMGRIDEAAGAYHETVRLAPGDPEAHYNVARALKDLGSLDEAIAEYRETIRLNPNHSEAHNNLGNVFFLQRRLDEAIGEYREAIRIHPENAEAHHNLAASLMTKGDYAEAWREIRLCEQYGFRPHPELVRTLSEKMPPP